MLPGISVMMYGGKTGFSDVSLLKGCEPTKKSNNGVSISQIGSQGFIHTGKSSISDHQFCPKEVVAELTADWFGQ